MSKTTILLIAAVLSFHITLAQTGVTVHPQDSSAKLIRVDYMPPSNSAYATKAFEDTLFCASIYETMFGTHSKVYPMQRTSDTSYTVVTTTPDSCFQIRFEICVPTDRAPDGIVIVGLTHDDNTPYPMCAIESMPADSAIALERKLYPKNYIVYYQATMKKGNRGNEQYIDSLIKILQADPTESFQRLLTIGLLYGTLGGKESEEKAYLNKAAEMQANSETLDMIFYQEAFWNSYVYPIVIDGKYIQHLTAMYIFQDVAAREPRSSFGSVWAHRVEMNSSVRKDVFEKVMKSWETSYDVDILTSIGRAFASDSTSPYFDPQRAMTFLNRAELSNVQHIGFRNGENIFGSMGRLDHIRSYKVRALAAMKKYDEAIEQGGMYLRQAKDSYGRESISKARSAAAKAKGDDDLAEELLKYELPSVADFDYTTINGTKSSISQQRGKIVVMDFWFLGCAGCAVEQKSLNTFANKYKNNKDVVFLSVALNDEKTLRNYMKKVDFDYDVVANGEDICSKIGVTGYPTHVILNKDGKTEYWSLGGSKDSGDELGKKVDELLK